MSEKTLRQKQKTEALVRMAMLGMMDEVKKDFAETGRVFYSERLNKAFNAVLYWADRPMLETIAEFESEHNALVYHCQLTHTEFGDLLSLLFVSDNIDEWDMDKADLANGQAFVRVENLSEPLYSEFGSIGIRPSMGGIAREW